MIVLLLFGLAIPSVNGLFKEQRLRKTFEQFDDFVSSGVNTIGNNLRQNRELTALRDWLLPMLMNGQVTVG